MMDIDHCPPEIWIFIFSLACTDGGFTGRSLSLVSKSFRKCSNSIKWQCISVTGPTQISSFAMRLRTPDIPRLLRSLFISTVSLQQKTLESERVGNNGGDNDNDGRNDNDGSGKNGGYEGSENDDVSDEDGDDSDWDEYRERKREWPRDEVIYTWYQLKDGIHEILRAVAPYITTLDLHTGYSRSFFLPPVYLSQIVDLSLYGPVCEDDYEGNGWQDYSKRKPFTTLRRLRLGYFDSFSFKHFKDMKTMAPNINELHLPCHPSLTHQPMLDVALGICEPEPSELVKLGGSAAVTLPSSVKNVYVQMDWRPPLWMNQNVAEFERIQREDPRLVFVKARFGSFSFEGWACAVVHKDWLERNEAFYFSP